MDNCAARLGKIAFPSFPSLCPSYSRPSGEAPVTSHEQEDVGLAFAVVCARGPQQFRSSPASAEDNMSWMMRSHAHRDGESQELTTSQACLGP